MKKVKTSNHVVQHLENAHSSLFEQHQAVLREYLKGRHGVYALYSGDRLYYVGLASNLRNRLRQHLRDRHRGKWDRFSLYITRTDSVIRELESLILRVLKPKGNQTIGRLRESRDLRKYFQRRIKEGWREQLADFFSAPEIDGNHDEVGGQLAKYVKRRLPLRMFYKKKVYKAVARPDGTIRFRGKAYASVTAAARRIRPTTNGWKWWRYERAPGEWVPLRELRRKKKRGDE